MVLFGIPARSQEIAITFDDLPAHSALSPGETREDIAQRIVSTIKAKSLPPVYGFVNGQKVERDPGTENVLEIWRAAKLPLGNHTWAHTNYDHESIDEFQRDVKRNEPLLKWLMGSGDWHWLRYPNTAEGRVPEHRDAARAFLAEEGYRIAAVTMNFSDWAYNEPYARCKPKGDSSAVSRLENDYLEGARKSAEYARTVSTDVLGREIPFVLLMHIGTIDAQMLPRLIDLYRGMGFRFVTLQKAERDSFYANDLNPRKAATPDTLEQAAQFRHISIPPRPPVPNDLGTICGAAPNSNASRQIAN